MQDVVLVAITSKLTNDSRLTIDEHDCVEGKLPKKSVVKPTKLFTMHSTLIVKRICALRREKLEEILEAIRHLFS
jgi:mRNA-degrading endonuclease toxin of MazEF toxin-antitoxin module